VPIWQINKHHKWCAVCFWPSADWGQIRGHHD